MERYKSWIPTVAGRLSFRLFGQTDYPSFARNVNFRDSGTRYIVVSQSRDLSDSIAWPWLSRIINRYLESDFIFACTAKGQFAPTSGNFDGLRGKLYIFRSRNDWGDVDTHFRELRKLGDHASHSGFGALRSEAVSKYQVIEEKFSEHSAFQADFSLSRNGIVEIAVSDTPHGSQCHSPPRIPEDAEKAAIVKHNLAAQLFFFLRDVGHKHQHHHAATDTIVDLYRLSSSDHDWSTEVLRALYRKVLLLKRENRRRDCNSALGIMAYIQSFRNVARSELSRDPLPGFNDPELLQSLECRKDELMLSDRESHERKTAAIISTLSLAGFLLAFLSLARIGNVGARKFGNPSETYVNVVEFALTTPIFFLVAVLVSAFFVVRSLIFPPKIVSEELPRFLSRMLLPFNRYAVTVILGLLGIASLVLAYLSFILI